MNRSPTAFATTMAPIGILLTVCNNFTRGKRPGEIVASLSALRFAVFTIALPAGKERTALPLVLPGIFLSMVLSAGIAFFSSLPLNIPADELRLGLGWVPVYWGLVWHFILLGLELSLLPLQSWPFYPITEVVLVPVWAWTFLHEMPVVSVLTGGAVLILAIVFNALTRIGSKPPAVTFRPARQPCPRKPMHNQTMIEFVG